MLNLSDDEPALITPISGSSAADITSAPSLRYHSPVGIPSRPALDRVDREERRHRQRGQDCLRQRSHPDTQASSTSWLRSWPSTKRFTPAPQPGPRTILTHPRFSHSLGHQRPFPKRGLRGRIETNDRRDTKGQFRRSAEARDPTDRLPLTVRERTFALRPSNGKVCPIALKN